MIIATLVYATTAAAQTPAATAPPTTTSLTPVGTWTVTPFIGLGFSGDLDQATFDFGVAGGYTWSPRVSFEGELNFLPAGETSGLVELNSNEWSLTGNVLYHLSGAKFVPYAALGLGVGHGGVKVDPSVPVTGTVDTSSTEFVINFGGGVERQLREHVAFRGDFRYFFGGDFVPDFWRASVGVTFQFPKR